MTITNLPALVVYAADAENVTFARGTLNKVTVTKGHVELAARHARTEGFAFLGGFVVRERDALALMREMARAES